MSWSGPPWQYVGRDRAAAHPKGRPGLALYLVALWLVVIAVLNLGAFLIFPVVAVPLWFAAFGALALLGAVLIALGAPPGWLIAVAIAIREIAVFVLYLSSASRLQILLNETLGIAGGQYAALALVVTSTAALLYLLWGDRPNLVYRHRYRKYSEAGK